MNLPTDGDLYCFEGGINDYWTYGLLGTYDPLDYDGELDTTTVCGAVETIFRYAREHFAGKPVVFIIPHKIQETAYSENSNGDTFRDYRDAMAALCEKYGVFCYDAFTDSGLDGSDEEQNKKYLTGNAEGIPDGTHPNEEAYQEFYVPQLIKLFEEALSG